MIELARHARHKIVSLALLLGLTVTANMMVFFGVREKTPTIVKKIFIISILRGAARYAAFVAGNTNKPPIVAYHNKKVKVLMPTPFR